jgi:hypothetical protein
MACVFQGRPPAADTVQDITPPALVLIVLWLMLTLVLLLG